MSAKVLGKVWDLVLTPAKQGVLLAMADHADHNGGNCDPGAPLIAWKTGYSERQVRRIMKDLEKDGLLVRVQERKKKAIIYQIDLSKGIQKPPYVPKGETSNHDKMSPSNPVKLSGSNHDKMSHDKMSGSQNQGKNEPLQSTLNPDMASAKTSSKTYKDKDSKESVTPKTTETKSVDGKAIASMIASYIKVLEKEFAKPARDLYNDKTARSHARDLITDGHSPEDLEQFMTERYRDRFWHGKSMGWKYIVDNLPGWKKLRKPKPPNGTYMDDLSLWRLEDMKRQEEEMRRNAG